MLMKVSSLRTIRTDASLVDVKATRIRNAKLQVVALIRTEPRTGMIIGNAGMLICIKEKAIRKARVKIKAKVRAKERVLMGLSPKR